MPELSDAKQQTTARETTPLPLGWPVLGSDGPLGRLTDVVVDPHERRVTHLVVEDRQGDARLVPAGRLVEGRSPGRVVVLSCSGDDLASLDSIRSFSMLSDSEPRHGDAAEVGVEDVVVVPGFGGAELGLYGPELVSSYGLAYDLIPTGSAELRHESTVVSLDGDEIGRVDGFLGRPADARRAAAHPPHGPGSRGDPHRLGDGDRDGPHHRRPARGRRERTPRRLLTLASLRLSEASLRLSEGD